MWKLLNQKTFGIWKIELYDELFLSSVPMSEQKMLGLGCLDFFVLREKWSLEGKVIKNSW